MVDPLLAVRAQDADELLEVELPGAEGDVEEVLVVDGNADRHGRHAAHGLFVEGVGVVDVGDLGKAGQRLVEEEEALRLIGLYEAAVFGEEVVGVEVGMNRLLARQVADEAASARRFLRRGARQRVELHILVAELGARGDAVPVVVEVDGSCQRHELVALGEGGRDVHIGDLLDLGQDHAEEGGDVPFGDRQRARIAEGFEQGQKRGGEVGRRVVDRIADVQEARLVVEVGKLVRRDHEAAAARALHEFEVDGGRAVLDLDIAFAKRIHSSGKRRSLHDRQKAREHARREIYGFAAEETPIVRESTETAVDEAALLVLPGIEEEVPKLRRDAGREGRRPRVDAELLAELDDVSAEEGTHELEHAAHDVEALAPDAKLQVAGGTPVVTREEEVRLQKERRFTKGGVCELLLLLPLLFGAREAVEEAAARALLESRCKKPGIARAFALPRLDLLQERDDMLAGAVVERGGGAGTIVSLHLLARLVEAHARLVVLRADDGRDVDGSARAAHELRDAAFLEVAAALAVRHLVRQFMYGGIFEQGYLSFTRGTRIRSF